MEPEAFRPERFGAESRRERPKFSYLPFGVGQRSCIGEPFAWVEGVLVLATLLQRWEFSRLTEELRMFAGLTMRPDGEVLMRVERRRGRPEAAAAPQRETVPASSA